MNIFKFIEEIGFPGFLDIAFMTVLIYSMLVWFKRTKAASVVIGLIIVGGAYLLARQLGLSLTTTVFQGFFAIILIAIVVIFQEEIKHFLEQIASRSLVNGLRGQKGAEGHTETIHSLVAAAQSLAREKVGALIVLPGKDPIERHIDGGMRLNGLVSEPLIRSLFDPHSPGHDGALVIRGDTVTAFSCYLPLSKNLKTLKHPGTRHAAALGLAEFTDALCLVVSEEEGTISVARNGDLRTVSSAEELSLILERFHREILPLADAKPWTDFFKRNYREKGVAIAVTLFLWFFFVHESRVDYRTYAVPVDCSSASSDFVVRRVEPQNIEITLSGPRRSFYFMDSAKVKVSLKLFDTKKGIYKKNITRSELTFPEGLALENLQPREVTVTVGAQDPQQHQSNGMRN